MSEPVLRNPGREPGKILDFDTYPHPMEFLLDGGMPGVEYLYVLASSAASAQTEGWSQVVGVPFFKVLGHAMTLLARGRPIPGARPGSSRCRFFIDDAAIDATGIDPTPPDPKLDRIEIKSVTGKRAQVAASV